MENELLINFWVVHLFKLHTEDWETKRSLYFQRNGIKQSSETEYEERIQLFYDSLIPLIFIVGSYLISPVFVNR